MAQEIVVVTDTGEGGVWVEGIQQSACNSCSAKAGCGQKTLSSLGKPVKLWVPTELLLSPGQQVILDLPSGSLAASAVALYGLPLGGLILGAVVGNAAAGDGGALLAGAAGLVLGFGIARYLANARKGEWLPAIVSVCGVQSGI